MLSRFKYLLGLGFIVLICNSIILMIGKRNTNKFVNRNSEDTERHKNGQATTQHHNTNISTQSTTKENCTFPLPTLDSQWYEWKQVEKGDEFDTHILSAFVDKKFNAYSVFLIGISNRFDSNRCYCKIWSADLKTQIVVSAEGRSRQDSHEATYFSWTYSCTFDATLITQPAYVSILESPCQPPINVFILQNAFHPSARNHVTIRLAEDFRKVNFTICLTPLNLEYDNYKQFIEWIELNRMFGVDRFMVYNYSVGKRVEKVLKYFNKIGILEIIPWKIPVGVGEYGRPREIHYYGQVSALNDCFHRSKNFSRFVVNVDVDEIIVPRKHSNYMDMLENLVLIKAGSVNDSNGDEYLKNPKLDDMTFIIKNTFFRADWSADFFKKNQSNTEISTYMKDIIKFDVRSLWVTKREKQIFSHGQRSKLIAGTKRSSWLNVHLTYFPLVLVSEFDALMHHYRLSMWDDHHKQTEVKDAYMQKFASNLTERLKITYEKLGNFN